MAVGKVVEAQSNRRNYVIAAAVGVIVILALALGLTFGLRKPGYPSAEPASLLASDNCPIFRQQVKDNETTTITGRLDVIVMDGAKTSQSYVLTTNAANERIQIIVSADREIELQEAKGMEVTVKGKKADCSLLIYNSVFGGDTDITVAGKSPSTSSLTSSASVTASSTFTKESIYTKLPTSTSSFVREIATSSLPSSLPSTSPLPPSKKIALVLFAFSNNPASTRETADQFRDRLFLGKNGQNGISPIFEKYSNGMVKFQGLKNLALSADVFGWYTLPGKDTDNCNYFDWTREADNQAGLASPGNYDHVLYIVNSAKSCNFGGIGHVPGWWSMVRNDWPSDTVAIALHELGHNLGWGHSGVCTNNQDSQAIFNNSAAESCNLQAYGDNFDLMGMPPRNEDSAWPSWRFEGNKRANARLAARNLISVSGNYELSSADTFPPPAGSVVASCWQLQKEKPRFSGYDRYCFELATSSILNVYHNSKGYKTAVLVRLVKSFDAASILLDSVLAEPGHSFTDPENGFRLQIATINDQTARIIVSV